VKRPVDPRPANRRERIPRDGRLQSMLVPDSGVEACDAAVLAVCTYASGVGDSDSRMFAAE